MIPWLAGIAAMVIACGLLIGFTAWLRFLDTEHEVRHDLKHRCYHKETGR